MDCKTGQIHVIPAEMLKSEKFKGRPLAPLSDDQADKLQQMGARRRKNYMRNEPCVCGSGVKFKKCCWSKFA